MDAFAQTGFHGATMKDVARRAGISYTGLLHHFPNKEDLLIAVLEFRGEQSSRLLDEIDGRDAARRPLDALRGLLEVVADNELRPGLLELHCVIAGEAVSAGHPAHAYYSDRYRKLRAFFTTVFEALAESGELRSATAPAALATMTLGLLNGLQAQWLYDRDTVDVAGCLRAFLISVVPSLAE